MSFEEIIPLLIGAGYLIFKAMTASNKKKEEELARRRAMPPVADDDSPYVFDTDEDEKDPHEILMEMFGVEREKQAPPKPVATPVLDALDTAENIEEKNIYANYNLPAVEEVDTLQSAKILDEMRKEAMKNEFKEEKEHSFWDEETFDMRRAVIYSEILHPKYAD